jgi:nitrate reductase gamma subunit
MKYTGIEYVSVPTRMGSSRFNNVVEVVKEIHMYFGGGILGTILIIALIVFLVRRSRI